MRDLIDRQAAIEAIRIFYADECALVDSIEEQLEKLPSAQPQLDEWCDDCKEYDKERHCCPRFNRVIRETLDDVRKEAYKHGKSKGIKRGMAMARRKEAGDG